jgi:hypothetical protein
MIFQRGRSTTNQITMLVDEITIFRWVILSGLGRGSSISHLQRYTFFFSRDLGLAGLGFNQKW